VGEIEPPTNRGLALAEGVPGETETRAEFVFREFRRFQRWRMNLAEDRGAARAVLLLLVKESGVVFPTRPKVNRQVAPNAPIVTHVPGKPLIVVSAVREPMRRRNGEEPVGRACGEAFERIFERVLRIAAARYNLIARPAFVGCERSANR